MSPLANLLKKTVWDLTLNIFSDLSERQLIKRFFGIFFLVFLLNTCQAAKRTCSISLSFVWKYLIWFIQLFCPHSRWKQEFVFFVETCWEKREKRQKLCRGGCFGYFLLEILHHYFFFVMICKIDLNINLVKMALIIFISDEAIFVFGGQ